MMKGVVAMVVAAALWGCTNPFLKKGCTGVTAANDPQCPDGVVAQISRKCGYLAARKQFFIPFLINQCGGIAFFFALRFSAVSTAVPVVNSLTFIFTAFVSWLLNEQLTKETLFACILIIAGVSLCVI
ncbi:transmembrane protein 234-like [Pelomyxa schiedti]|nr:transmembrane protein 234-like [Pelomyxa schiedti]